MRGCAALVVALCIAAASAPAAMAAQYKPDQIRIQYVPPKNAAHLSLYERLKEVRALERLRILLSPLKLPRPLPFRLAGCDGESNAWYDEEGVTVCYEFMADVLKAAPDQTLPSGIARQDAILGPVIDVFLHEAGHAAFDLLKVPVLGREEDAADMFSVYIMLQFGKDDARRLILGTAYQYKADVQQPQVSFELKKFSDEHGTPAQRFFNVLCAPMARIRKYSPMLWTRATSRKSEPKVARPNTSRSLSRSKS